MQVLLALQLEHFKWDNGSFAMEGYIGEIFFAKSVVNSSERQKVEGYLAHKWGLTNSLPSNHPFRTYAPEKASHVWVKAPSISGTNTVITAAWGKSGTETTPDYATNDPVWSNGYEGVWHLNTISSGTTNDSRPQGTHLTVNGGAITTGGQTGSGISLDGTDDDLEALGYKGISGGAQRSIQLWIKSAADRGAIMHWGSDEANTKRWTLRTTNSGLRLRTEIAGGGRESNSAIGNNVWTHISATCYFHQCHNNSRYKILYQWYLIHRNRLITFTVCRTLPVWIIYLLVMIILIAGLQAWWMIHQLCG